MVDKEQLSAFMDGESSDYGLLDKMSAEPEKQAYWSRYHLIGDAMRDELPSVLPLDFAERVSEAIAAEPTVLAPVLRDKRRATRMTGQVINFGKRFGQYAIAATVAGITIIGVQNLSSPPQEMMTQGPTLSTVPILGNAAPVSANFVSEPQLGRDSEMTPQQMQQQRTLLNAYLLDHQLQERLHP